MYGPEVWAHWYLGRGDRSSIPCMVQKGGLIGT